MSGSIRDLLVNPESFFEQMSREPVSLLIPAAIIFAGCLLNLFSPYIISIVSYGDMPAQVLMFPETAVIFFVLPLIAWLFIAAVLFGGCRLLSGSGTFVSTLQASAYGCIMLTMMSFISLFNGFFTNSNSNLPAGTMGAGVIVIGTLCLVFLFWAGWLWSTAMTKIHNLSLVRAMVPAVVVILFYISPLLLNILVLNSLLSRM